MGSPNSILSYGQLVAMVTYFVKIINKSYLAIITLSLSRSDTEWHYKSIKMTRALNC